MVDGLVISENIALFEELNINFSNERNHLEYAKSVDSAKEIIALEIPDYLAIIEKSVEKTLDLLKELHRDEEIKKIPKLCFISNNEWLKRGSLWNEGVRDIIKLPVAKDELKFQLDNFIEEISDLSFDQDEAGMFGKLEDYNLVDLIQTLESSKKTGVLILYRSRDEGKIWFQDGKIRDAKYRAFEPLESILKMVSWLDGDFSITFVDEQYEDTIELENQDILLEAIQHLDDRNRILNQLPNRNEVLLISPEADMDKMEEEEVNFLRFFHGGHNLASFLDAFDQDDLTLLNIVSEFVENKLIMTRNQFDQHFEELEQKVEEAGIKNVFKRFFTKKEDLETKQSEADVNEISERDLAEPMDHLKIKEIQFKSDNDQSNLDTIKNLIEKL
jgi:hypothetical protein